MVSKTSIGAYKPKSETRINQKSVVFNALWEFANMGQGATCDQLAEMTKIKPSTVYGRLGDLKAGYMHNGSKYYCVVSGTTNGEHCTVQTYTLTTEYPKPTLEEIEAIKKKALVELRKWRQLHNQYINSQVKTLFDEQ